MKCGDSKLNLKFKEILPWFVAAVAVLSANCAASAVWESITAMIEGGYGGVEVNIVRSLTVGFFFFMVYLLYRQRKAFFRPRTRHMTMEPADPRKHQVLFLSTSNLHLLSEGERIHPEGIELSNNLNDDIKQLERLKDGSPRIFWTWEMPLRALLHHSQVLESVVLVCSPQSIVQSRAFVDICRQYDLLASRSFNLLASLRGVIQVVPFDDGLSLEACQGFNFEGFDELSHAFWVLLEDFERRGCPEKDIMVDITGGQKPASVVGAVMTFNREIKAQYIQTNPPWAVITYDVIHGSSDTGQLGL